LSFSHWVISNRPWKYARHYATPRENTSSREKKTLFTTKSGKDARKKEKKNKKEKEREKCSESAIISLKMYKSSSRSLLKPLVCNQIDLNWSCATYDAIRLCIFLSFVYLLQIYLLESILKIVSTLIIENETCYNSTFLLL